MIIWPAAMPIIVIVSVICVTEAEMPKSEESSGRAGRYMSVERGAIALITPRKIVRKRRVLGVIVIWINHLTFDDTLF